MDPYPYFVTTPRGEMGPFNRKGLSDCLRAGEITRIDGVRNAFGRPLGNVGSVLDEGPRTTSAVRRPMLEQDPEPVPPRRMSVTIVLGFAIAVAVVSIGLLIAVKMTPDGSPAPARQPVAPKVPHSTLAIPQGLRVVPLSSTNLSLSWGCIQDTAVIGFVVQRRKGASGTWEDRGATTGSMIYSDQDLVPGTCYGYRVRARSNDGVGDPGPEVAIIPVTDSASAFSFTTQGAGGWSYGYYAQGDPTRWTAMTNRDDKMHCWNRDLQPPPNYCVIGNSWMHPPGDGDFTVRRWLVPAVGSYLIVGHTQRNASDGNGVNPQVRRNGAILWSEVIPPGDKVGRDFNLAVTLVAGDTIDLVLDPYARDNAGDTTVFTAIIVLDQTGPSGGR